jgi:phosphoribosyl-ATP pyrophosphohydrolase/phosphoribosyl-AMP cyclohydrolase
MNPDFSKYAEGLLPVIVQDINTNKVLMLGFMNEQAFHKTKQEGKVTFYSRSQQRLWTKGETSGNYLIVKDILSDCDHDTLLVKATPLGPVCHTGAATCFGETNTDFTLEKLEQVISQRKSQSTINSYTATLFSKGINSIAQKVGEEAVELVIESKDDNKDKFLNEAADLLFHYLVLLQAKGHSLADVSRVLGARYKK